MSATLSSVYRKSCKVSREGHDDFWVLAMLLSSFCFLGTDEQREALPQPCRLPLSLPLTLFPGAAGPWPLMTSLCPSSPSKQRHNKLWRQQTESRLQQPVGDLVGSGDFLPETLDDAREARLSCLDDAAQPGFPGGGGPSLSCCFRRLSDPLLRSPSDETGGVVQLKDLEKDALLEEAAQPPAAPKPARPPQEGPGPCEEAKKKPDFGSPRAHSGPLPVVEEMEREEAPGGGRWGRSPAQLDKNLLNRENLNNNNSKRSCPEDFEVGATSLLSCPPPSPFCYCVPPAQQFLPPGAPGFEWSLFLQQDRLPSRAPSPPVASWYVMVCGCIALS